MVAFYEILTRNRYKTKPGYHNITLKKMKLHESFYIIGILLIIVSIAIYFFSTTMIADIEDNSASNLWGKTTEIDSSFVIEETLTELSANERQRNRLFLWIGIPVGIGVFLFGMIIKRKREGRDLFIDDELEDDEEADFPLF